VKEFEKLIVRGLSFCRELDGFLCTMKVFVDVCLSKWFVQLCIPSCNLSPMSVARVQHLVQLCYSLILNCIILLISGLGHEAARRPAWMVSVVDA